MAAKQQRGEAFVLIDVRQEDEYRQARIPFAVNMPRGFLEAEILKHISDPQAQIICHCGGGGRSALAAQTLQQMGFRNVASMAGGLRAWKALGLPVDS